MKTWQRYVAIGDSFSEGMCDPDPAREDSYLGWADRLAHLLAADAREAGHEFRYANLAIRGRLLDDILGRGRSQAYAHGAAYLQELDLIAERADLGGLKPDPAEYRQGLKRRHGRKYGFWDLVEGR